MAYATTYQNLRDELVTYVEDNSNEFESELGNIIARAQDRVQADLDLSLFHQTVEGASVALGAGELARPANCMRVLWVYFSGAAAFAEYRSLSYVRSVTGSGAPKFYNDDSPTTIQFAPLSSVIQTADIRYLARLEALSDNNPSNWLSVNAGQLLFHAAVIESERYLKDADMARQAGDDYAARLAVDLMRFADLIHRDYSLPQSAKSTRRS